LTPVAFVLGIGHGPERGLAVLHHDGGRGHDGVGQVVRLQLGHAKVIVAETVGRFVSHCEQSDQIRLVYFTVIWYICPRFGMLWKEKSGNRESVLGNFLNFL
jgi:hypothetical protein